MIKRVLLALGVVALDLAVFFVPLTAIFMAYILIHNPPWFREFLNTLDAGQGKRGQGNSPGAASTKQNNDSIVPVIPPP